MSMTAQVLLGSCFLTVCTLVHVGLMALCIPLMTRAHKQFSHSGKVFRSALLLSLALVTVLVAHTVQIWTWAFAFQSVEAFDDIATSFYFATVTYTTLGYGDLTLGEGLQIFATFGAITGLLTFGISTAFLIAIIGRLLPPEDIGTSRL